MSEIDSAQRAALERELAQAEQERERIEGTIAYLRRRLGARVGDSAPYSVPLPPAGSLRDPQRERDDV
jgi:hypothetical protein